MQPQAPSEIRGKNVEAIIAGWTAELEARSAAFVKHAAQLAEWDRHILTNRRALLDLEDELQRVAQGQEALEKKLGLLETHQKEVHDSLVSIESEAARMYQEERPLLDDDSAQRDALYERADRVAAALASSGDELRDLIADVNEGAAAALGAPDTPLAKAVRILNNQLQALTTIEARTGELEARLSQLDVAA